MVDSNNEVRSNYGWQWERNYQLDYVVAKLKDNPNTRHAAISIYDGKQLNTKIFELYRFYYDKNKISNSK